MKTFELNDSEIDLIRHSLVLFQRDCKFDLVTYAKNCNLDALDSCSNALSNIEFLLNKIKF